MGASSRSFYWDNLKGILIFLVVVGHFLWEYVWKVNPFPTIIRDITFIIYLFHMPAFLFVSGYFSRTDVDRDKLIKLFLIFVVLNYSMMYYACVYDGKACLITHLYYSSWYLFALFLYRLSLPFICKIPHLLPISLLVSLVVGYLPLLDNLFVLNKIVALYPFFIGGFLVSKHKKLAPPLLSYSSNIIGICAVFCLLIASIVAVNYQISVNEIMWYSYKDSQGVLMRIILFILAGLFITQLLIFTPNREIKCITQWGRNSLAIYFLHRIFTLLFVAHVPLFDNVYLDVFLLCLVSIVLTLLLGGELVSVWFNRCVDSLYNLLFKKWLSMSNDRSSILIFLFAFFIFGVSMGIQYRDNIIGQTHKIKQKIGAIIDGDSGDISPDIIFPLLDRGREERLQGSIKLSFIGDLILLRDMVSYAYDPSRNEFDFSNMFQYTEKYFKADDLTIGVFEGPMAGAERGFSTSNYSDGIPLYLNFPDAFSRDIKDAGIDLVTTANNHVLDMGIEGAHRTLDILDAVGLSHLGSYRDLDEKDRVKIVRVKGVKIALLAYTYGSNYYTEGELLDEDLAHITSILVAKNSPYFRQVKKSVANDFKKAKALNPDIIIALPHMGTQFSHTTDAFQELWNNLFISLGADIILGSHSHAVQPIEWRPRTDSEGGYTLIVNCPGNYVNSYTEYNGDASAIVEVYLNPVSGKPVAVGLIPAWGYAPQGENYRAVPIADFFTGAFPFERLSLRDTERIEDVQKLVSSVMLGTEVGLDQLQERYVLFPDGFYRERVTPLVLGEKERKTQLFKLLASAHSAMFIGDSITHGTKNGGYGWYEPLIGAFPHIKHVYKAAWGGETSQLLLQRDQITEHIADVYIIAIGTNDVRYRSQMSAKTPQAYIKNMAKLVDKIKAKNPHARFVFIGAWTTDSYDPIAVMGEASRRELLGQYRIALKEYCAENGFLFIDPNPSILRVLRKEYAPLYLKDHIHPNARNGVHLYSHKVIESSP